MKHYLIPSYRFRELYLAIKKTKEEEKKELPNKFISWIEWFLLKVRSY